MNQKGQLSAIVIIALLIITGIAIYFVISNSEVIYDKCDINGDGNIDIKEKTNCGKMVKPPVNNVIKPTLNQTKPPITNKINETTSNPNPIPNPDPIPFGNLSLYEDSPFGLAIDFNEVELRIALDIGYSDALSPTSYYLNDLGIRWIRPVIFWDLVENEFGYLNFSSLDYQARDMHVHGIRAIHTFISDNPHDNQLCHSTSCAMPCNEADYINFIRKTVERYDGDSDYGCDFSAPDCYRTGDNQYPSVETRNAIINAPWTNWELGNEEDNPMFFRPCVEGQQLEEYSHLLQITQPAVKAACANCKMILGGLTSVFSDSASVPAPPSRYFLDIMEFVTQNLNYLDVVNYHVYGILPISYEQMKYYSDRYSGSKEIVITEMGSFSRIVSEGKNPYSVTPFSESSQAQELVKRVSTALYYDVKIIDWFNLMDGPPLTNIAVKSGQEMAYGLIDADAIKKLSYYTYKLMIEKLEESNLDEVQTISNLPVNVYAYRFVNKNTGNPTYVVWWEYWAEPSATSKTVNIAVSGISENALVTEAIPKYLSGAQVTNFAAAFNTETRTVSNGQVSLVLGENPVYVEQG